ncbi:MAG: molybdopterin synthase catalytic subunit MoaE [Burkholderiaceae bacterium]
MEVRVQHQDFDVGAEIARLRAGRDEVGAVASFIGTVRGSSGGAALESMTLEHYPGMTEASLAAIGREAAGRWAIDAGLVIHRIGELRPGDQIVLVVVLSRHRGDAFAACEFIMDYLKTRAPFWKKERTSKGESWVQARDSDTAAASRWASDEAAVRAADQTAGRQAADRTGRPKPDE